MSGVIVVELQARAGIKSQETELRIRVSLCQGSLSLNFESEKASGPSTLNCELKIVSVGGHCHEIKPELVSGLRKLNSDLKKVCVMGHCH